MRIGVPKEIKNNENRVGLVPASARELINAGHDVTLEINAGLEAGFPDQDYIAVGAKLVPNARALYDNSEMIVKVKELQLEECKLLRPDHLLVAYLHLAPDPKQTELLLASGCVAIAYETVTDSMGALPLLSPMSEVAGRLSIQAGAHCLEKRQGGSGVLLGGVPGVAPAKVLVLGGGSAGTNAVRMAIGLEANVTVIDKSIKRLKELDIQFGSKLNTIYATQYSVEKYTISADLVIGAVLVPGATAPKLVTREMIQGMRPGSVLVDVSIDQGGCFETSHPTTHDDPTYVIDNAVHYCVTNMPAAVPRTSTIALNNVTLPFILALANKGYRSACIEDPHLLNGLNIHKGKLTYAAVAEAQGLEFVPARVALQV